MPSSSILTSALLFPLLDLLPGTTLGVAARAAPRTRVPVWFLAGDSTTALQSSSGGGWGAGFLSFLVPGSPPDGNNSSVPVVESTDYAVNGATTVSFVADGYWARVLDAVGRAVGAADCAVTYEPFVTIQVCCFV